MAFRRRRVPPNPIQSLGVPGGLVRWGEITTAVSFRLLSPVLHKILLAAVSGVRPPRVVPSSSFAAQSLRNGIKAVPYTKLKSCTPQGTAAVSGVRPPSFNCAPLFFALCKTKTTRTAGGFLFSSNISPMGKVLSFNRQMSCKVLPSTALKRQRS